MTDQPGNSSKPGRGSREQEPPDDALNGSPDVELDIIERKLDPYLSGLDPTERLEVIAVVEQTIRSEEFRGPLPHPKHLKQYNEILPGTAERIFK